MKTNRYTAFFAAYSASVKAGNYLSKEELVQSFTGGATTSLKELTDAQLAELTAKLNALNPAPVPGKEDKMRKSIIAIFRHMNRTPQDAIDWAEKQGVKGVKKRFNDYTSQELYILIRIAEKIHVDKNIALRKQIQKAPF